MHKDYQPAHTVWSAQRTLNVTEHLAPCAMSMELRLKFVSTSFKDLGLFTIRGGQENLFVTMFENINVYSDVKPNEIDGDWS